MKNAVFHRRLYLMILTAIWAAFMVIGKELIAFLPNIEIISLLITVFTLKYRKCALAAIYVFVVVQGVLYGFGSTSWINYLYVWTILWCAIMLLPKIDSAIYYAAILGTFGLLFGALCAPVYIFYGGPFYALSWFLSGIKFDLLHLVGNVVITLALYRPIMHVMKFSKYGIAWPEQAAIQAKE